jgi:tetratricopeptide (TPR) repeat protein
MWLEAAKQSAERSANLEANAQLRRALEEVKKLPAGVERDNLELNIQISLIGPTIALQGFAAVAVAEVSSRAIELCRALNNDPRIFPALYARWSYARVSSNLREAGALAQDFLTLAEQRGTRTDRMVGHALLGTSLLDGRQQRRAIILSGPPNSTMQPPTARRQSPTAPTCRSRACPTCASAAGCWAGLPKRSRTGEMRWNWLGNWGTRTPSVTPLPTSACCTHWSGTHQRSEPWRSSPLSLRPSGRLPLWSQWPAYFGGWCELGSGHLTEGIDLLEKQRSFVQTAYLVPWRPTYLCWLAGAYIRAEKLSEAKLCLEQAREIFGRGGNYWYQVECLRIEGLLAAHSQINDATEAEQCFEQALALAHQRGQRGFALRAAHGLADHLAGNGQPERARELLEEELKFYTDQPDRGDRVDAKALLCSLQGVSPARTTHS